jgi:enoyl-CoA hydratase/carnithine racemase
MGRVVVELSDRIATVTISAPPMNALDAAMRAELAAQIQTFEQEDRVRAVVLRGDGPKAFCAGFDLKELSENLGSAEKSAAQLNSDAQLFDRLAACSKPTLAAVEGVAFGGGLELAVCCDFIIASERARFALPEIRLGAIPAAGGTVRVTRQIGPVRARQMILLGDAIDAATALDWGLVTRVAPELSFSEECRNFAAHLAKMPARAVQYAKRAMIAAQNADESQALATARDYAARLATSADLAEGVRSFLERRDPVFSDTIDRES